ncbi:hypothetical protein EDD11_009497 [Mortierella claussenii]|nr:hypothetical protein EDD11_009497 [Mortierella claussenii]
MTSVLFQSTGKSGFGSSSSSSSSAANPFQALAHFYEQELTDLQIDSNFNSSASISSGAGRQCRQQNHHGFDKHFSNRGHQHLFPSSPRSSQSSSSRSSPMASSSASFSTIGEDNYERNIVPYTQQSQDEFTTFSRSALGSPDGDDFVEVSPEYLRQRQECYTREAKFRGRDRHDGLGPVIDFSEDMRMSTGMSDRRWEDHFQRKHFNPYASMALREAHGEHQMYVQSWVDMYPSARASSQQEQVVMDLGQSAVEGSKQDTSKWNQIWGQSPSSSPAAEAAASQPHHNSANRQRSSIFKDAAASIPSSWPLAPWALETEAALLEQETIHSNNLGSHYQQSETQFPTIANYQGHEEQAAAKAGEWTKEFALMSLTPDRTHQDVNSAPGQQQRRPEQGQSRRASLKTCGFMWDAKSGNSHHLLDPITALSFAGCTPEVMPSKGTQRPMSSQDVSTMSVSPVIQSSLRSMPSSAQLTLDPIERLGQVYNDDVFEGDMLQAWMDTLAQEKQEADESAQEKGGEGDLLSEVDQAQVLEIAVRRLNALMHQLDRRQTLGPMKSAGLVIAAGRRGADRALKAEGAMGPHQDIKRVN